MFPSLVNACSPSTGLYVYLILLCKVSVEQPDVHTCVRIHTKTHTHDPPATACTLFARFCGGGPLALAPAPAACGCALAPGHQGMALRLVGGARMFRRENLR